MLRSAVADQPPECTRTKLILSLSLLKRLPGISKNSSWHYRSSTGSLYTILPEKFKQSEILAQWMPNMLCPTLLPMGILYEELSLFLGELFTGSEDFVIQSWEQSVTKQWLPGDGPAKAMMMSRAQPSATVWGGGGGPRRQQPRAWWHLLFKEAVAGSWKSPWECCCYSSFSFVKTLVGLCLTSSSKFWSGASWLFFHFLILKKFFQRHPYIF